MKKFTFLFSILALGLMILISSCKKDESYDKSDDMFKGLDADLVFLEAGDFEKIVVKPLVKLDDCKYVVEGTIEF